MQTDPKPSPTTEDGLAVRLRESALPAIAAGAGGGLVIGILAFLTQAVDKPLLIAPFGASCVLLFAIPQSPLARPRSVIGGHLVSSFVGLAVLTVVGGGVLACALSVGLAITLMQVTETLHPPAGGDPLVVILTGAGWSFLGLPVLAGTTALVVLAWLYHRHVTGRPYALAVRPAADAPKSLARRASPALAGSAAPTTAGSARLLPVTGSVARWGSAGSSSEGTASPSA